MHALRLLMLAASALFFQACDHDAPQEVQTVSVETAWVADGGGVEANEWGQGVTVDSDGNVIVVGALSRFAKVVDSDLDCQRDHFGSQDFPDVVVAKLDPRGRLLWARCAGHDGYSDRYDYGADVATDRQGNIYVTGMFHGPARFGAIQIPETSGQEIFVAKLSPSGKFLWVTRSTTDREDLGGEETPMAHRIAVDRFGSSYVVGHFRLGIELGDISITNQDYWRGSLFVAKLDPAGKPLWVTPAETGGEHIGWMVAHRAGIAVGRSGSVYIASIYDRTARLGQHLLKSRGGYDALVARLDAGGRFAWAQSLGGAAEDGATALAVDDAENLYVAGIFGYQSDEAGLEGGSITIGAKELRSAGLNDVFVTRLSSAGDADWSIALGGLGGDVASDIAVDDSGRCYVTGHFELAARFGEITLTGQGWGDAFVARLDQPLKDAERVSVAWATAAGGSDSDVRARGVAVDSSGEVTVTGVFAGKPRFGGVELRSRGEEDLFVWKLREVTR
jgi:hypothetical protein